jgi:hypothetical protein
MQDFEPDLMLADFVLAGGSALADKLGIPKAVMVPFFGSGIMNNLFGSGASLLATVPQFSSRLPRHMVSNHVHSQRLSPCTLPALESRGYIVLGQLQVNMSFYDPTYDNRNALCCLACSVVLLAHSQKNAIRSGYQAHCRVFTKCIQRACHDISTIIVYAELASETAKPGGTCNE